MDRDNFIKLSVKEQLLKKIQLYMKTIWYEKVNQTLLNDWLRNFKSNNIDDIEQTNVLYLLSKFTFFGDKEFRVLVKSMYRDLFCRPLIYAIRKKLNNTLNEAQIKQEFDKELNLTRFVGIGSASESGVMLTYFFRQENDLVPDNIIAQSELIHRNTDGPKLAEPDIKRYVFLDDFIGSGTQGIGYLERDVKELKSLNSDLEIDYLVLVGTEAGINAINQLGIFNSVQAVFVLDSTFQAFSANSRYYESHPPIIDKAECKSIATHYGATLYPQHMLGFQDCQLLFGFAHNTPDSSLPIFWSTEGNWTPIFKRYIKQA